ncbi:MAG TPA: sigma 54-interacting transcriptional regulator, partial [Polyangia bacterium]|nr:sigma 54-interacting transcriptional regulator [Polyangia bacterium]
DGDATREDDGAYEATTETCVLVRLGAARRVIEVRDHREVVIGRSSESTFVADDDRVSRRHLRIRWHDGALYADDLGSRNGSTLNGRRLAGERALEAGDELAAGPVRVTVCGRRRSAPIVDEGELTARLAAEVERAVRFKRQLGVVGLSLRGSPNAIREAGLRVASRLRRIDLIGEYAPGELLLLLPESGLEKAAAFADEAAALARGIAGVEASALAAAVPETGAAPDVLIAATLGASARPVAAAPAEPALVAEDPATRELLELARRAARSNATVLVLGETGSGKELLAAEMHRASARAAGPYVRINCASLPETLLDAELFGHERGAFTGADRRRVGFIETAAGGTLLLDEIGELPLGMQAKLLRVLEERKVTRVGGTEEIPVDVRFLASTNRDLEREVARGAFREDLYFRLSGITLRVPPLRERPRELPVLAEQFARGVAATLGRPAPRLSPALVAALKHYPWPGNVRELKNVIERAVILADSSELGVEHLPQRFAALAAAPSPARGGPMREQVDELERRNLVEALRETAGNRTHAARRLGISRRALIYKLKKYGLS